MEGVDGVDSCFLKLFYVLISSFQFLKILVPLLNAGSSGFTWLVSTVSNSEIVFGRFSKNEAWFWKCLLTTNFIEKFSIVSTSNICV